MCYVSWALLQSDGVHYPAWGGQHCQEGICLLCRNILIGPICIDMSLTSGLRIFQIQFLVYHQELSVGSTTNRRTGAEHRRDVECLVVHFSPIKHAKKIPEATVATDFN